MIVQLTSGTPVRELETAFESYELSQKSMISRHSNMWLFTYNTDLIKPADMLKAIKDSALTIEAEFNKKVTIRGDNN